MFKESRKQHFQRRAAADRLTTDQHQTTVSSSSITSHQYQDMMQMEEGEPAVAAHEAEIMVPGSFVVLQGLPGDGMANTIDTQPALVVKKQNGNNEAAMETTSAGDDFTHVTSEETTGAAAHVAASAPTSSTGNIRRSNSGLVGADLILKAASLTTTPTVTTTTTTTTTDESFVVVSDEEDRSKRRKGSATTSDTNSRSSSSTASSAATSPNVSAVKSPLSAAEDRSIDKWSTKCRHRETRQRDEQLSTSQLPPQQGGTATSTSNNSLTHNDKRWWLHETDHTVLIFSKIPFLNSNGVVETSAPTGTLSPGSTVVANELLTLSSTDLRVEQNATANSNDGVYPKGRFGEIQLLRLISPKEGFVVLSVDGYSVLAPGLPAMYTDPRIWMWRVTCAAGAFVREGLELTSKHVQTLPYGSFMRVTRKTVNSMGLSRLRVYAVLDDDGRSRVVVEGWISELLNPLSGQRGYIARPVPFPLPASYKVTLRDGAVIRSDVELSSPQIGLAPQGSRVTVVGRAFTDHPSDQCIQRLKLAGNGGWVSVKLNFPPPQDEMVVEMASIEGSFDPDLPGVFHMEAQQRVYERDPKRHVAVMNSSSAAAAEDDDDDGDGDTVDENGDVLVDRARSASSRTGAGASGGGGGRSSREDKCLICLTNERNATIVHGETGHIACCLVCARILSASGERRCPVCRLPIDSVIQQFWA